MANKWLMLGGAVIALAVVSGRAEAEASCDKATADLIIHRGDRDNERQRMAGLATRGVSPEERKRQREEALAALNEDKKHIIAAIEKSCAIGESIALPLSEVALIKRFCNLSRTTITSYDVVVCSMKK